LSKAILISKLCQTRIITITLTRKSLKSEGKYMICPQNLIFYHYFYDIVVCFICIICIRLQCFEKFRTRSNISRTLRTMYSHIFLFSLLPFNKIV